MYHPNKPPDNDFPRSWDVYFKANGDDGGCRLNETLYNNVCPSDEPLSSFYDWELANLTVAQLGLAKHMSTPFFIAAGLRRPHRVWHVPRRFYDLYENNGTDPTAITLAKHKTGPTGMPEIAFIDNAWYVSHALALAAAPRSDISECIFEFVSLSFMPAACPLYTSLRYTPHVTRLLMYLHPASSGGQACICI